MHNLCAGKRRKRNLYDACTTNPDCLSNLCVGYKCIGCAMGPFVVALAGGGGACKCRKGMGGGARHPRHPARALVALAACQHGCRAMKEDRQSCSTNAECYSGVCNGVCSGERPLSPRLAVAVADIFMPGGLLPHRILAHMRSSCGWASLLLEQRVHFGQLHKQSLRVRRRGCA